MMLTASTHVAHIEDSMAPNASKAKQTAARSDGRKPLLVYLDPKLIQDLKVEALKRDTHVYLIVEQLLKARQE